MESRRDDPRERKEKGRKEYAGMIRIAVDVDFSNGGKLKPRERCSRAGPRQFSANEVLDATDQRNLG